MSLPQTKFPPQGGSRGATKNQANRKLHDKLMKIKYNRKNIHYDIANLCFVIADIHGEAGEHAVHQTADVCESGNIDRINEVLRVALAAVERVLAPVEKYLCHAPKRLWTLVHEYLVCRGVADWLSVTLPQLAAVWREKAQLVLDAIAAEAATLAKLFTTRGRFRRRPLSPF